MNPFSIRRAADEHPERAALVVGADDGRSAEAWSFARLAEAVETRRADVGVRPVLVAEPGVETVLDLLVAFEAETTVVPLHARWSDAERKSFVDALCSGAPPESDALAVLATSGSTGKPKGVELSRRAFLASAEASERRLGWQAPGDDEAGDRWLLGLPLAHVGGLSIVVRCLLARQAIVVPPTRPRFDAAELAGWLDAWGVTLLSLVPTQLRRLLDLEDWRPPANLRAVLLGGAAASPALVAEATSRGVPVRVTYGLTEACSQVATGSCSRDPGVGRPLDGVEVRIDDPDAEGVGTIAVRGPVLMTGYRPADGPGAGLDPDGFFRTSDLGRLDEEGVLHVVGRADDVIVTGGENVHPRAVEDALEAHPSVARACVLGVNDAEWGQAVVAFVEPAAGREIDGREVDSDALPVELRVDLRSRLAAYAVPREIRVVDSLPTTASGKIDRRRLLAP